MDKEDRLGRKLGQGEEGTLAGECPGEWYVRHVHENFLYVFVPLGLEFVTWVTTSYLHRHGQRRPS